MLMEMISWFALRYSLDTNKDLWFDRLFLYQLTVVTFFLQPVNRLKQSWRKPLWPFIKLIETVTPLDYMVPLICYVSIKQHPYLPIGCVSFPLYMLIKPLYSIVTLS